MKRLRSGKRALLVVSVIALLDFPAWGQGEQPPFSPRIRKGAPAASSSVVCEQRAKKIGPPQVIEIPLPEPPPPVPSPSWQENADEQASQNESLAASSRTARFSRPGYLGVLYATAEAGSSGVRVLDIIAGSPAERAGFSASPPPPTKTEQVLTVAVMLVALSPLGFLAIPLALAHDAYYSQPPERGDLITAVAGQPVRDAQEFNDVMRHFGPGDTVTFVVQRGSTQVRLSAQLEAEP